METLSRSAFVALLLACGAGALIAQQGFAAGDATAPLGVKQRQQVVDSVASLLERIYVTPDTGRMIANHLRQRSRTGAYNGASTVTAFADALTTDIRAINGDRHLNVRAPGQGPRSGAGQRRPLPGGNGIDRVERLEGNVGYLKLSMIASGPAAFDSIAKVFSSFGSTDAMILDLRGVPGGSAQMANFIISHFTPPNVHSLNVFDPATRDTTRRHTLASVPGPRRTDVSLYVLVDGGSASAAEDIPFVLQNLGRGTIVGEKTAGAGRNNRIVPVGHGLAASISTTRVWDPRTGREWERVGITPDIATSSADALQAALQAIQKRKRDPSRRQALRRTLPELSMLMSVM